MKRYFAVSDVHGKADQLKKALIEAGLIDKNLKWLDPDHYLIVCGDNIDKGNKSKETIELLITLHATGNVYLVIGNHEYMVLQGLIYFNRGWFYCWLQNGGIDALLNYGVTGSQAVEIMTRQMPFQKAVDLIAEKIGRRHLAFMASMLTHLILDIEGEKTLFVHAGVNPYGKIDTLPMECDQTYNLHYLWIRNDFFDFPDPSFIKDQYGVDRIVFGHTPTKYITGRGDWSMKPVDRHDGRMLAIDTGTSYGVKGAVTIVEILPNLKHNIAARVIAT